MEGKRKVKGKEKGGKEKGGKKEGKIKRKEKEIT